MRLNLFAGLFLTAVVLAFGGARFAWRHFHSRAVLSDLTAAQQAQVDRLDQLLSERTAPLKQALDRSRGELIALVSQPAPDPKRIEAKLREISQWEQATQREFVQHLLRMKKVLTPAQQERLFRAMGERLSLPGPGVPSHRGPFWQRQPRGEVPTSFRSPAGLTP
jgi:Spy/CpxP family protein refolding chaperone